MILRKARIQLFLALTVVIVIVINAITPFGSLTVYANPPVEIIMDDGGTTKPGGGATANGSYLDTNSDGIDDSDGVTYRGFTTPLASFTYTPTVTVSGTYDLYAWFYYGANYSASMPFTVNSDDAVDIVNVPDLRKNPANTGEWRKIGRSEGYNFTSGGSYTIVAGGDGYTTFPRTYAGTPGSEALLFDAIKLVKVEAPPEKTQDQLDVEAEALKYEITSSIVKDFSVGDTVTNSIIKLKDTMVVDNTISVTPTLIANSVYFELDVSNIKLKAVNNTATIKTENVTLTFTKGTASATTTVVATIDKYKDRVDVDAEALKYENATGIAKTVSANSIITSSVIKLKNGMVEDNSVTITTTPMAISVYFELDGSDIKLKTINNNATNETENVTLTFTKGDASTSIIVAVTIEKQGDAQPFADDSDPTTYFTQTDTLYRNYAPGIINPNEGTIELTVRINKPVKEFGNTWDFLFRLVPISTGPGFNLINAHIPPPNTKPTGAKPVDAPYAQDLIFFVKNGDGTKGAFAYAKPTNDGSYTKNYTDYTVGQAFNLAFAWKLGVGGYVATYMDGVEIARTATDLAAVKEGVMPYKLLIERYEPYNVTNIKISTKALAVSDLETNINVFDKGTDTSLLANITYGQEPVNQTFKTPWHTSSGYSVVKPAFRLEKQVFTPTENPIFPVMLLNHGSIAKEYTVTIKGKDAYGNDSLTKTETITVPADSKYHLKEIALGEIKGKVGYYSIETSISSTEFDQEVYKSEISVVPSNDGAVDGSYADYYGQHIPYFYDVSLWDKMNVRTARTWDYSPVFLWGNVEPVDDQYTYGRADTYVADALASNMDVLAVLGYPSDWASARPIPSENNGTVGFDYIYKAQRWVSKDIKADASGNLGTGGLWRDYVYTTMTRYAGKVKYFEILNEVNFHGGFTPATFSGTKEEYFYMQKIAYEEAQRVKAEYKAANGGADLELYVVSSGYSSVSGTVCDRQMVLDQLNDTNVANIDIFDIHGYSGTAGIKDILTAFNAAKAKKPSLELWQGEVMAFSSADLKWRIYDTVFNYMDFLSVGTTKYISMGTISDNVFTNRFSSSPTVAFQTMAVLQSQIRKVQEYSGAYSGFPGENLITVKHYLKRTDNNYLSVLSSDSTKYDLYINNADKIISAVDSFGNAIEIKTDSEGKKYITKENTAFIVSSAILEITGLGAGVEIKNIKNGDFERVTGDSMGGASAVKPSNWELYADRGIFGTHSYVLGSTPFEGTYALVIKTDATYPRSFMAQKLASVTPGTYVLSAYIKQLTGDATVKPELNIWDNNGNVDYQLIEADQDITLTNAYKYYSRIIEVTDSMKDALYLNVGIYSGIGSVEIDNVSFELVPANVQIEMDDSDTSGVAFTGTWSFTDPRDGANKNNFHSINAVSVVNKAVYSPSFPISGRYKVEAWLPNSGGNTIVPVDILHAEGKTTVNLNQNMQGGKWIDLGSYNFNVGDGGTVTISCNFSGIGGAYTLADGLRFSRVGDFNPSIPVTSILVRGTGNVTTITTSGGALQMLADILPANATNKDVTWSVVNGTGSAIVTATGLLTATGDGTVTIKATANDGSNVVGTEEITISNQTIPLVEDTQTTESETKVTPTPADTTAIIGIGDGKNINLIDVFPIDDKLIVKPIVRHDQANVTIPYKLFDDLESKNKNLVIKASTELGDYEIPLNLLEISNELSGLLKSKNIKQDDVSILLTISNVTKDEETKKILSTYKVISTVVDFKIDAVNNKTGAVIGELETFDQPLKRFIPVPSNYLVGVKSSSENVNESILKNMPKYFGVFKYNKKTKMPEFVQNKIVEVDGAFYYSVSSYTNSIYFVAENNVSFNDVSEDFWGEYFIKQSVAKGLSTGVGNNNYEPNRAITRAEFLQMVLYAINPTKSYENIKEYRDVSKDEWYYNVVMKAKAMGVLDFFSGYRFNPNSPITRGEMANILASIIKKEKPNTTLESVDLKLKYSDYDNINKALLSDIQTIVAYKIMQGTSEHEFDSNGYATRAQASTVQIKLFKLLNFID